MILQKDCVTMVGSCLYTMPENRKDLVVQRIVVKEGFSRDLADALLADYRKHLEWFKKHPGFRKTEQSQQFAH